MQGNEFFLELPEGMEPWQHLDFSPVRSASDIWPPELQDKFIKKLSPRKVKRFIKGDSTSLKDWNSRTWPFSSVHGLALCFAPSGNFPCPHGSYCRCSALCSSGLLHFLDSLSCWRTWIVQSLSLLWPSPGKDLYLIRSWSENGELTLHLLS